MKRIKNLMNKKITLWKAIWYYQILSVAATAVAYGILTLYWALRPAVAEYRRNRKERVTAERKEEDAN